MLISVVVPTGGLPANGDVDIGISLPLESIKGIVSVLKDGSAPAPLSPDDYTASVVDDNTVNIVVKSGATALDAGDIVNIVAILRGEIARP